MWRSVAVNSTFACPAGLRSCRAPFSKRQPRPITLNGGMSMPGWYDIFDIDGINSVEDSGGIEESARYVSSLVQSEIDAGTPANRIVVGGFSQGGAVALMMLRSSFQLAAVAGLSTYLPLRSAPTLVSPEAQGARVFMAHGTQDPLIKYEYGDASQKKLKELGLDVDFRSYPMPHTASEQELQDLGTFLRSALP